MGTWNTLEDMWISPMSIYLCWGFVSTCGNMYVFDRKQMMKFDNQKNLWTFVATPSLGPSFMLYVALWGDRIFVTGVDNEGHLISYLFQLSTGKWIAIEFSEDFAGFFNIRAATLEI
jgi:hypothetical protein